MEAALMQSVYFMIKGPIIKHTYDSTIAELCWEKAIHN